MRLSKRIMMAALLAAISLNEVKAGLFGKAAVGTGLLVSGRIALVVA